MLGYDSDWDEAQVYKGTPLEFRRKELVEELEEKRYFVVSYKDVVSALPRATAS